MNTTQAPTATYTTLGDGSTGLLVAGRTSAGRTVTVGTETVTIGSVLCQASGDEPAICTIARPAAKPARPSRPRRQARYGGSHPWAHDEE